MFIIFFFQSVYKNLPRKIDVTTRMVEMSINGHEIADEHILKTAQRRRPPHWSDQLNMICFIIRVN